MPNVESTCNQPQLYGATGLSSQGIMMRRAKKSGKRPFTTGQLNRIVDTVLHPHFKERPWMILVDGLAHATIEQNPKTSIKKFAEFSLPGLLKMKRSPLKAPGKKKRRYRCELPVRRRFCGLGRAGYWCLTAGTWSRKCQRLHISYE